SIRQFETEGAAAVVRTKRRVLNVLVYVVVAAIAGLLAVGRDAFLLLTGPSKAESAPVFVILCLMFVAGGLVDLCASGLQLYKRSMTVLTLSSLAAVVNVLLNVLLIPRFGVMGAVYATLGSAATFGAGSWIACPRDLFALPNTQTTVLALGLGALVLWVAWMTQLFGLASHHARLAAMASLAAQQIGLTCLRSTGVRRPAAWRGRSRSSRSGVRLPCVRRRPVSRFLRVASSIARRRVQSRRHRRRTARRGRVRVRCPRRPRGS